MYRYSALGAGAFYTLFGILGLIPPLHENWPSDEPMMTVRNGRGFLFGIFPNNFALAFMNLGIGVWGLFAFRTMRTSKLYVKLCAVIFALLAVAGLLPPVTSIAGVIPTFGNVALLHLATAVVLIAVVLAGRRERLQVEPELPSPALGAGAVSAASIAGIPVHVFLSAFPLAFLLGALATDLAHWWTTLDWYVDYGGFWATASVWLIGAGLGGALLSSVAGLIDVWAVKATRRQELLSLHVLGSAGVIVLAAVNLAIRFRDHDAGVVPWGILLSVMTAGLLVYSGWYAGHLIHRDVIINADPDEGNDDRQVSPSSVSIGNRHGSRPS